MSIVTSRGASRAWRRPRPRTDTTPRRNISRYFCLLYFLEVGVVLVVAPWTTYWDRNLFMETLPLLEPLLTAAPMRGSVSGIGVVNLCAAGAELGVLMGRTHPV